VYIDRNGEVIKSVHIWLPAAMHELVRKEGLNLSQFVREQLEVFYGEQSTIESLNQRVRLITSARDSLARHRELADAAEMDRERLRGVVRQMREERVAERAQHRIEADASAARTAGIREAILAVTGESCDRYWRALPENDTFGNRIDDWDALVDGVSRWCGEEIEPADVAEELRRCIALGREEGVA
jgi:CRISPR/Cas system-associated endonuclease Cas1